MKANGRWLMVSCSIHDRDRKLGDGSSDLGILGINQLTHGLPETSMLLYPNLRKPGNYHGPPRSDLQLTAHQKKTAAFGTS